VKIGGFQYLVKPGEVVTVPRLKGEPGSTVRFNDVMMVRTEQQAVVGTPLVPNSYVEASIVDHIRKEKVTVYKFIRRENYRRKKGHRQPVTRVRITSINYQA
jgi:large subunit ribosomal protein L21